MRRSLLPRVVATEGGPQVITNFREAPEAERPVVNLRGTAIEGPAN